MELYCVFLSCLSRHLKHSPSTMLGESLSHRFVLTVIYHQTTFQMLAIYAVGLEGYPLGYSCNP